LEKEKTAILLFTEPIKFILNISEVFGSSRKKERSGMTSFPGWYPERSKVAVFQIILEKMQQLPDAAFM
jgi:hypothetical protein